MVFNPTFTNTDSSGLRTDRDGFGERHDTTRRFYDTRFERDIIKLDFFLLEEEDQD